MPELADVEGFKQVLSSHAAGRPVHDIAVLDASVLIDTSSGTLRHALRGHAFAEPRRHGKWLVAPLQGSPEAVVLFHFGMTGELVWAGDGQQRHRHDRVIFFLAGGELRYRDLRKLKGLRLTNDEDLTVRLSQLGPDAIEISVADFVRRFRGLRRQLKTVLTDQGLVAGLGNLMADEVCWRARVHPRRKVNGLAESTLRDVHKRMRSVARSASQAGFVPGRPSWLTGHRSESPGRCPRCGAELEHGRVRSRSTVWCPCCQPAG